MTTVPPLSVLIPAFLSGILEQQEEGGVSSLHSSFLPRWRMSFLSTFSLLSSICSSAIEELLDLFTGVVVVSDLLVVFFLTPCFLKDSFLQWGWLDPVLVSVKWPLSLSPSVLPVFLIEDIWGEHIEDIWGEHIEDIWGEHIEDIWGEHIEDIWGEHIEGLPTLTLFLSTLSKLRSSSLSPVSLRFISLSPVSLRFTSLSPVSLRVTSLSPVSLRVTSLSPVSLRVTSLSPKSLWPTFLNSPSPWHLQLSSLKTRRKLTSCLVTSLYNCLKSSLSTSCSCSLSTSSVNWAWSQEEREASSAHSHTSSWLAVSRDSLGPTLHSVDELLLPISYSEKDKWVEWKWCTPTTKANNGLMFVGVVSTPKTEPFCSLFSVRHLSLTFFYHNFKHQ